MLRLVCTGVVSSSLLLRRERIRRIKHWGGLPTEAVRFCLQEAGITLAEVDHITVAKNPKAKLKEKISHSLGQLSSFQFIKDRMSNSGSIRSIKTDLAKALGYGPSYSQSQSSLYRTPP